MVVTVVRPKNAAAAVVTQVQRVTQLEIRAALNKPVPLYS